MIPSKRAHLLVAAASHEGMTGKNNEDRYSVSAFRAGEGNATPVVFAMVADGIGGHRAGEVAAELAVETISQAIAESDASQPVKILENVITQAGRQIYRKAEENPAFRGMGSTCACAWVIGNRLFVAWVGDSRVYLIRKNSLTRLTVDHTWVQEAIDQGALRPEQARNHPNAHVIRRYLGSKNDVTPDFRLNIPGDADLQTDSDQGALLQMGDIILICSDGLTDLVDDDEILLRIVSERGETSLRELIDMANERGGHDNITIITLTVPEPEPVTVPLIVGKIRRRALTSCTALIAVLVFLLAVTGGVYLYLDRVARDSTPNISPAPASQVTLFPEGTITGEPDTPATPVPSNSPVLRIEATFTPDLRARPSLTPWPTNTSNP